MKLENQGIGVFHICNYLTQRNEKTAKKFEGNKDFRLTEKIHYIIGILIFTGYVEVMNNSGTVKNFG